MKKTKEITGRNKIRRRRVLPEESIYGRRRQRR
jgi:hypothetical protein